MAIRIHLIALAALPLLLSACSEGAPPSPDEPGATVRAGASGTETGEDAVTPAPPPQPSAEELAAIEAADTRRRERGRELFNDVMEPLTEAAEAYEEHESLEESTWFGRDQEDNLERIDGLLDDAIEVLGVSEIATTRREIRLLEEDIRELEAQMMADREARLGAPPQEELGPLEKAYRESREELDQRLEDAARDVADRRERIAELHDSFVTQMRAIGVELDHESARSLLSSVTGDDFVEMCVVFDNVRGVTVQLQELTEESGESLDAAKRYYGSYVVLIRLMDRIQRDFVRRAEEEMIPQLVQYGEEAERLIDEAQENLERGGDRAIGEQNIRSNELTIHATELYVQYLRSQAEEVRVRNDRLQVDLRDAENTYETVALSSEVAALLREGSRNFAALLRLDVPSLREFENAELRAEFERLTQKLTNLN